MHIEDANTLCIKAVVSQIDAAALIRVLKVFQDRNVNPRKVTAQRILLRSQGCAVLHIEIEFGISDLTMDALGFIAANLAQMPLTLSVVFGNDDELSRPCREGRNSEGGSVSDSIQEPHRPDNVLKHPT